MVFIVGGAVCTFFVILARPWARLNARFWDRDLSEHGVKYYRIVFPLLGVCLILLGLFDVFVLH